MLKILILRDFRAIYNLLPIYGICPDGNRILKRLLPILDSHFRNVTTWHIHSLLAVIFQIFVEEIYHLWINYVRFGAVK